VEGSIAPKKGEFSSKRGYNLVLQQRRRFVGENHKGNREGSTRAKGL